MLQKNSTSLLNVTMTEAFELKNYRNFLRILIKKKRNTVFIPDLNIKEVWFIYHISEIEILWPHKMPWWVRKTSNWRHGSRKKRHELINMKLGLGHKRHTGHESARGWRTGERSRIFLTGCDVSGILQRTCNMMMMTL